MGRLIEADEYEKRIKPYDTEDVMDKALYNFAHTKLLSTPTARPKGKWIEHEEWFMCFCECSVCGAAFPLIDETPADNLYNYCPNCGSEMEGE